MFDCRRILFFNSLFKCTVIVNSYFVNSNNTKVSISNSSSFYNTVPYQVLVQYAVEQTQKVTSQSGSIGPRNICSTEHDLEGYITAQLIRAHLT